MSVLILGGTAEARDLAVLLQEGGLRFSSSLAGRVARPRLPVGEVRVGGFGGIDGLRRHLTEAGVTAVVDATHPFAAGISANAAAACAAARLATVAPTWTTPIAKVAATTSSAATTGTTCPRSCLVVPASDLVLRAIVPTDPRARARDRL
ncbi:cobalt-precorrin-6A reductase, partial [Acinetobacter baumannii]|nr:cobalt-precorrin-6A reductase [Acinetobacter baumannii]